MIEIGLLTYAEVAAKLGVSVFSVQRYVKSGKLVPNILGFRTVRFDRSEVNRFIRNRRVCKPKKCSG